jgi:hypothetical protein
MKLVLAALTIVNLALIWFGGMMAMMSPMMFDAGGQQDKGLWAIFWAIIALPVIALAGAILPWLLIWMKWQRAALVAAAIPLVCALVIGGLMLAY